MYWWLMQLVRLITKAYTIRTRAIIAHHRTFHNSRKRSAVADVSSTIGHALMTVVNVSPEISNMFDLSVSFIGW